jgi:hypothetical protein
VALVLNLGATTGIYLALRVFMQKVSRSYVVGFETRNNNLEGK